MLQNVENDENQLKTFHKEIESFKEEYLNLEKSILRENNCKNIIVFVDDLDRCDPDNVLNLLSAIKLFFTFAKRTIFICGIDKDAVNKAVLHKYKDVVKASEYLEKVFDVSFNMPKANINQMVKYYLSKEHNVSTHEILKFFNSIHFTNPRHLKKALNKYLLLRYYKFNRIGGAKADLIPNLDDTFYKILTLFIIILYEFEPRLYEIVKNYEEKLSYYADNLGNQSSKTEHALSTVQADLINNIRNVTISQIRLQYELHIDNPNREQQESKPLRFIGAFMTIFSPKIEKYIPLGSYHYYCNQFNKDNSLLSCFCSYLYKNQGLIPDDDKYIIWNIFEMAELYL